MKGDVALRKESVDRNCGPVIGGCLVVGSLSARRAWIEMPLQFAVTVDRFMSLSARRAWIEMILKQAEFAPTLVALRKESVDRNA